MVDGIPMNTQSAQYVDLSAFSLDAVERIEIIKGAASSMWGSGLGGVINIITKDTGYTLIPKGSVTASAGGIDTQSGSLEFSGGKKDFGYYLSAGRRVSGSTASRGRVEQDTTHVKASYDIDDDNRLTGIFGYSDGDVQSGLFPDDGGPAYDWRRYVRRYGKAAWEYAGDDGSAASIEARISREEQEWSQFYYPDLETSLLHTMFKGAHYQLSGLLSREPFDRDLLVAGIDLDWESVKSVESPQPLDEVKSLSSQAPYIRYTLRLDTFDAEAGLRYDRTGEFGHQWSPSLGFVYHVRSLPETAFRASVARAFNIPRLLWKYYDNGVSTLDNRSLKPERAWVYDLGFESRPVDRFKYELDAYWAEVEDVIVNTYYLGEPAPRYMTNQAHYRRQGVEARVELDLSDRWSTFAAAAFNRIEDRHTGKRVRASGKPRQSFDLGLRHNDGRGLTLELTGEYDRWNVSSLNRARDRTFIFDARIARQWQHLTVFLNIYNLGNSTYYTDYYYPLPERYAEAGITLSW